MKFSAVFLFLLIPFFAQAQSLPLLNEVPLQRAFDPARFEKQGHSAPITSFRGQFPPELIDSFQSALDARRLALDAKGLSAAVLGPDGELWTGTSGDSYAGTPMTTNMYLGMGSISKTFTAACILKLEEEGLLSIEDTIGTYLPPYPNISGSVTIKQLLNHTSGFFNYTDHPAIGDSIQADLSRVWTPEEVLNTFVNEPYFAPGTGWTYSNTNFVLAGLIIEQVTGMAYHEAVRQKLLVPAGLEDVFLNPYENPSGPIAHVWLNHPSLGKIDMDGLGLTPKSLYSMAWAAGAFFARPELLVQWMSQLMNGQVLSEASLNEMKNTVPTGTANFQYGLGLMQITQSNGALAFGHSGYIIYASECFYDTKTGLTIAIQTNDGTATDLLPFLEKAIADYSTLVPASEAVRPLAGNAYPNPAHDLVWLKTPTAANGPVQVVDMWGHAFNVPSGISGNRHQLDVSALPAGMYMALLQSDGRLMCYRFVKE